MRPIAFIVISMIFFVMLLELAGRANFDTQHYLSEWAERRITHEFKNFAKSGFTLEDLNHTEQQLANRQDIVRFQIVNNNIYASNLTSNQPQIQRNYNIYYNFLARLIKLYPQEKNIDFLIALEGPVETKLGDIKAPLLVSGKFLTDVNAALMPLIPSSDILQKWPALYDEIIHSNNKNPWVEKISKAFWRGSSTDGGLVTRNNWRNLPRVQLVELADQYPSLLDAKFVNLSMQDDELNRLINERYPLAEMVSESNHLKYKTQIFIEGNKASFSGLLWRLLGNSVVLKQDSSYVQWYSDLIKPWEHYVPFDNNLANIITQINWIMDNDHKAEEIANNATKIIETQVTPQHIYRYFAGVLMCYGKMQNFELKTPTLPAARALEVK